MTIQRQKLTINYDELFPGESLTIGSSSVIIRPLNIEQIALLSKKIRGIGNLLEKEGVTWENYSDKSSLFKISIVLLNQFPEVLEEASNIYIDDLKKLPPEKILEIVTKIIEVNLKSKDNLVKNFNSLTEKLLKEVPIQKTQTE